MHEKKREREEKPCRQEKQTSLPVGTPITLPLEMDPFRYTLPLTGNMLHRGGEESGVVPGGVSWRALGDSSQTGQPTNRSKGDAARSSELMDSSLSRK